MNIKEIEARLRELKGKQSDHFKKKKAQRDAAELQVVRDEMNALKAEARKVYRG